MTSMKVTRLTESDTGQPVQFLAMFSIMTQYYVRNVVKVLHIQLHVLAQEYETLV